MGSLRPGPRDAGDVQLGGSHASWGGECVLGGLVCYDYGLDEGSVQNVAAALFVGLVVAWAVAIFASYASRRGARRALKVSAGRPRCELVGCGHINKYI